MLPHRNRRNVVLAAAVGLAVSLSSCSGGSRQITDPSSDPGNSSAAVGSQSSSAAANSRPPIHPAAPLEFLPVRSETQGNCPAHSATMIEDPTAKTCLHLAKPALTVTTLRSVEATSQPQWSVNIGLGPQDARRFKSLTTTMSRRSSPQNKLAVVVGSPSTGRLLTAPEVVEPIAGGNIRVIGALTRKSANELVHDLGG
ncbi:MAG TPA: hypothetical protein VG502_09985 [Flexivirga sp.]|uniref:SecDF P1 head subdomain-containing protein n=1 Tax=Flexivirga sp. TaxID=1962927 RepID=UPI002C6F00A0|nr:hypothetical protein [Flexivirga sp.]HWC22617.1 hypothetical protein [Flexivirga sp.]